MAEILDLIEELEAEGKYEEALEYLQIVIEENMGSYDVKSDMGRILNKMARYDDALDCFNVVLAIDDSHQESLFGKGISSIGLNNFEDALESFNKLIQVDKLNANAWYYKSLVSKALGDNDANIYFRRFNKEDNDNFKFIRSFYHFGILFDEIEYRFRESVDLNVINEVKDQLKSLNLDEDQYLNVIRTVPLEKLFDKIIELKGVKGVNDEKDVIRQELIKEGFTDEDVEDMFIMYEDIDELKQEVIELCGHDPFKKESADFVPIKLASRYNIIKSAKRLKNNKLYLYNRGNFFYDEKDFKGAIECYDECLKFNPGNKKFEFMKFCANYNLRDDIDG